MKTVKNLEYFCIGFLIYGMSATVVTYFLIKANKKQARMINSLNNICDNVNNILKDENDKVNIEKQPGDDCFFIVAFLFFVISIYIPLLVV